MKQRSKQQRIAQMCFSILLLVCCVLVTPAVLKQQKVYAATDQFEIEDGVLKGYTGSKIIVEVPDGVTRIEGAFRGREDIEQVILPDSVEYIAEGAFQYCNGLTTVEMSSNLKTVDAYAFKGCTSLQTMDLSQTDISVIPCETFANCTNLTDVKLPESVLVIGKKAFSECEHLGRVNLPEGLRTISYGAFGGCHSLCSITLPESLTYMGEQAFLDCIALESIAIPGGITTIQESCFAGDYSLKKVYLPDSLKVILKNGFDTSNYYNYSQGALSNIYIPASVECITDKAFDQHGKTSIIYGEAGSYAETYAKNHSVEFIEKPCDSKIVFDACGGKLEMKEKMVTQGEEYGALPVPVLKGYCFTGWYADQQFKKQIKSTTIVKEDSVNVYARWEKETAATYSYQGPASDFTIKDGVLTKYNGYQSVVVVPDTVKEIASCAFEGCRMITAIILPESLEKIGKNAFERCESLLELSVSEGVTEIPEYMCYQCVSLEKVSLPKSVTKIGKFAFSPDNGSGALKKIELPERLQSIDRGVFMYCGNLISVDLPDSLLEIGRSAFCDCSSLRKIAIPAKVATLETTLFSGCDSLEQIQLVDGLETINSNFLKSNSLAKTLYIPESVTTMNEKALYDTNLTVLTIEGIKDSTAYDYYEGMLNSSEFSNMQVNFEKLSYDANIQFDTQVAALTVDDKKAIIGKGYGLLPELESEEDTFLGWSLTKHSSDIVKTTDLVEGEKVVLYAVWKNQVQEEKPSEEEPDGQPTLLPSDSTDENLSEKDYIEIRTAEELSKVRENLSGNYRLMEDIDLSADSQVSGAYDLDGYGWRPIGASEDGSSQPFTGIFDGNGHVIKGIVIKGEVPYKDVGLFARLEGGTIKDLTVDQASIEIGGKAVRSGILVGYTGQNEDTNEKAVIHNCSTTGGEIKFLGEENIASNNITIGGITGYMGAGTLSDSRNSATITYYSKVQEKPDGAYSRFLGGISGYLEEGRIEKCRNTGTIDAFRNYYGDFTDATPDDLVEQALAGLDVYTVTGGICGVGSKDGNISECFNSGDVKAYLFNEYTLFTLNVTTHVNTMAGGICGALYRSTAVENCYNTGSVYSYADRNTTLVDKNASSESMIDAVMALLDEYTLQAPFQNAKGYAAGIVGYSTNTTSGPVKYCYNTGSFKGSEGYVHAIANGTVPVAYCRYKDETITNSSGEEEKLVGSSEYADSLSRCMAIDKDKMNLCEMYRGFDFANVWFLVDGSVMEAPQLYSNMVSEVTKAEFLEVEEGALKTVYEYGEKLDLTGLKVSVTLQGIEEPLVFDVPSKIRCGYDAYTSGKQTLSITYFGVSKEIEVTVNKKKFPVIVNGGEGSGSYCEGTVISISAPEPEAGVSFTGWVIDSGDVTIEDPAALETTFVMGTSAVELTAVYEDMYYVTINNGEGSGYYKVGETVTVKADNPAEGEQFSKWTVISGGVSLNDVTLAETAFVMPKKAVELTAMYETITTEEVGSTEIVTSEEEESTEAATTEKVESTEAVTTEKEESTEAATTEKEESTEAATTEKEESTETATTEKEESTEAATTEKEESTETATTEKEESTETATTEKVESTETATTEEVGSIETEGSTVGALYTDTKAKAIYKITGTKTVEYCKSTNAKAKSISIASDVTINGKKYQVTSVASNAFNANKKITKVVIGKNVKSIGKNAFRNCTQLKTVEIKSKTLNKIGANAFSGSKKLTKITLKTTKLTKKSIGKNAFKGTNKKLVIKVPKQQLSKYKGYFKGKGNKTVKVKS